MLRFNSYLLAKKREGRKRKKEGKERKGNEEGGERKNTEVKNIIHVTPLCKRTGARLVPPPQNTATRTS